MTAPAFCDQNVKGMEKLSEFLKFLVVIDNW